MKTAWRLWAFIFLLPLSGCHREPPAPAGPLFDVPSLLGKTMGEIEKALGAPAQTADERKVWKREGHTLTVNFSPSSNLVSGFALELEGEPRKDEARDDFLKLGNLKEGDERYQLSFIEAPDKVFHFTGVRVEIPQTHKVEFRVDGPEALVSVTALAAGGSGGGQSILTIPPWNAQTTANIGQDLALVAEVMTKPGQAPPKEKLRLQILVDGRVLKEASAAGVAKCQVKL